MSGTGRGEHAVGNRQGQASSGRVRREDWARGNASNRETVDGEDLLRAGAHHSRSNRGPRASGLRGSYGRGDEAAGNWAAQRPQSLALLLFARPLAPGAGKEKPI